MVTLVYSVSEGLLPAMRDPLTIDARVAEIARKSNASTGMVWALRELHVHPAIFNPFKILRELWLDRAILLGLVVFAGFQIFTVTNVFVTISIWWFAVIVMLLMPMFIFYARGVESEVKAIQGTAREMAPLAARITGVKRVIHGHTHLEHHGMVEDVEVINTGTWSPAFHDVECTQPYRKKCFAWVKPTENGTRVAALYEWVDGKVELVPMS